MAKVKNSKRLIAPNGTLLQPKEERVIKYMQQHGSISCKEAENYLHDHRLAASVHTLRRRGYEIDTLRVDTTNAYGEPTWYGRYVFSNKETHE